MLSLFFFKYRRKFESRSWKLIFEKRVKWDFIINRSNQNLRCVKFKSFKRKEWRYTRLLIFWKIISLCRRCFCCRMRYLIRVQRVENVLCRRHVMMMKKMTMKTRRMIKMKTMMTKIIKTTMLKITKRKRHVEKNSSKSSKKIKMFSRKNRSTCRLILSRLAIKMTSMWNRKKARKTLMKKTLMKKKLRQTVRSIRSTNFSILTRKRSRRRLRRFNDALSRNRRSIRNQHSIFDEVLDDRQKRRSKKESVRFLTKKTSNRRSNVVVVAQNFNRFCFACIIKLNNDCVFFCENLIIKKFYLIFRLFFVRSSNFWSRSSAFMFFFVIHSLYFFDQFFHLIR